MSNVFDQALETAMERTSAWVKDQESMGMVVTEQMAANKFRVIYEQILLNTQIDVLNFWTEREYNISMKNITLTNCELLKVTFEQILNDNKDVLIRLKNI